MLTYSQNGYKISITNAYPSIAPDNTERLYDAEYINNDGYKSTSLQTIEIFKDDVSLKKVLIGAAGGGTSVHPHSAILNVNKLVTCCSDTIFCFSLPDLNLLWKVKGDMITCFQIFEHDGDYIVHGEVEISRLDKNGQIIWQQSGADIFLTLDGKEDFKITPDGILATDFVGKKYNWDFDGKLVTDQ